MYRDKDFEICQKVKLLADLGFQGIANSIIPHKKSRKKPSAAIKKKKIVSRHHKK
jgi:hypothetical protein